MPQLDTTAPPARPAAPNTFAVFPFKAGQIRVALDAAGTPCVALHSCRDAGGCTLKGRTFLDAPLMRASRFGYRMPSQVRVLPVAAVVAELDRVIARPVGMQRHSAAALADLRDFLRGEVLPALGPLATAPTTVAPDGWPEVEWAEGPRRFAQLCRDPSGVVYVLCAATIARLLGPGYNSTAMRQSVPPAAVVNRRLPASETRQNKPRNWARLDALREAHADNPRAVAVLDELRDFAATALPEFVAAAPEPEPSSPAAGPAPAAVATGLAAILDAFYALGDAIVAEVTAAEKRAVEAEAAFANLRDRLLNTGGLNRIDRYATLSSIVASLEPE